MPKILYITTEDRFFLSHIKERAEHASNNGFKIAVAAKKTQEKYVREIESCGFEFFDTQVERQSLGPITQLRAIKRLLSIYLKVKPDISHHLGAKAIIYGTIACKLAASLLRSTKIVNAPIGLGYVYASDTLKAKLLKPILTVLYHFTLNPTNSEAIFENPDDLEYFVKIKALRRENAHCIYGAGVNTKLYAPSIQKYPITTVVMGARLIKEKGVIEFIKAAQILAEQNVPVNMVLVGEPDYGNPNSISKKQFENFQQLKFLKCLGYRNDMSEILRQSHICCLPSFYREGLPRFLIEGACCGLAIITTDTVGCREVVANNNGFLLSPLDFQGLALSIKKLVENPELCDQLGKRSRTLALKKFDSQLICEQTLNIYKQLIESPKIRGRRQ